MALTVLTTECHWGLGTLNSTLKSFPFEQVVKAWGPSVIMIFHFFLYAEIFILKADVLKFREHLSSSSQEVGKKLRQLATDGVGYAHNITPLGGFDPQMLLNCKTSTILINCGSVVEVGCKSHLRLC